MVVLILATASCFSSIFMGSGGGDVVQELILESGFGKWGMFIIMMVILFFLGMFIDWIGIILICFPLFLPIAADLGFDQVWFIVIIAVMLQDSFLTPPFGYALFYLKGVAPPEVTTADVYWGAFPFWRPDGVGPHYLRRVAREHHLAAVPADRLTAHRMRRAYSC